MRAKFEHERFAVAAAESGEDVVLDEDLFRGFKEELEQERLELDMRREELELDLRMLEEENDRLKSRLGVRPNVDPDDVDVAEEATIVTESRFVADIEDAVEIRDDEEAMVAEEVEDAEFVDGAEEAEEIDDIAGTDVVADDDAEGFDLPIARNTIFGAFNFDEDEESVEDIPEDDGWSSEPDDVVKAPSRASLIEAIGGDGATVDGIPEGAQTDQSPERNEPSRPAFDHMLTSDEDRPADGSIQQVLGLSDSDLALMHDLGYGTFRAIADLSDGEIERLAETFDIPETRIREEWIPDSRVRVAREPRA